MLLFTNILNAFKTIILLSIQTWVLVSLVTTMDLRPAETVLLKVTIISLIGICLGSISCENNIISKTNLANIFVQSQQ